MMEDKESPITYESPLEKWPGSITLPHPDDFNGDHWETWRAAVENKNRLGSVNRLYAYAGAEFLSEGCGEWLLDEPSLETFKGWEAGGPKEKMRLTSWVGRRFKDYMEEIVNPKG